MVKFKLLPYKLLAFSKYMWSSYGKHGNLHLNLIKREREKADNNCIPKESGTSNVRQW